MNTISRRSILKALGLVTLSPAALGQHAFAGKASATLPWHNWSGALSCQPAGRISPATTEELSRYLANTSGSIRPVGSGHSFSALVPTDGHLIAIDQFHGLLDYDEITHDATFAAGTLLSEIGPALNSKGRALNNMPDIDRQTIAGALATATHGTGLTLGCLSDEVTGIELIKADGEIINATASRNPDVFNAARVNLGALGIVTAVTFRTRAAYRLKAINRIIPMRVAIENFLANARQHRHYEIFPLVHSDYALELTIDETDEAIDNPPQTPEEEASFGQMLSVLLSMPVLLRSTATNAIAKSIESTQAIDHSYNILSNLRTDRFNEMEYSVEINDGMACLEEILQTIKADAIDVAFPLEVRCVRGDDTWLGMSAGSSDHISISIHRSAEYDYQPYFNAIEPIFAKYGGRPHWGKIHSLTATDLISLYPRFSDFNELRAMMDPEGRLLNDHLQKILIQTG